MKKLLHIGIIVKDINKYLEVFTNLGGKAKEFGYSKEFGAVCLFIDFNGIQIELIKPQGPKSMHLTKFIEKYGEGLHHLAFEGKGDKEGALKGMYVSFNKPNENNRILIEEVEFKNDR